MLLVVDRSEESQGGAHTAAGHHAAAEDSHHLLRLRLGHCTQSYLQRILPQCSKVEGYRGVQQLPQRHALFPAPQQRTVWPGVHPRLHCVP